MALINGNGVSVVVAEDNKENIAVGLALKHNVGLSVHWSREEQSLLEDLLVQRLMAFRIRDGTVSVTNGEKISPGISAAGWSKHALKHYIPFPAVWSREEKALLENLIVQYASDKPILRYAKIAGKLQHKTVRDVALRCRWMSKKEIGKRRKDDSRRHREKRDRAMDLLAKPSAHTTNLGNGLPYAQSAISIDSDDGISYKDIGGLAGQLLEENAQALEQISANFSSFKVHENISLISQTRNNIVSILNDLNNAPELMKQMPPLPVKLNDELADSILLQSSMPMKFESFRI